MRWFAGMCAAALMATVASGVLAHDGHGKDITWDLALKDRGCPGNATLCFVPYMGELMPVHGSQILVLLMRNDNDLEHKIRATSLDRADPERRDTTVADPLVESHDLPRGILKGSSFVVPAKLRDLYVWCDTPGHEEAGMWFNATVLPPENKQSPGPSVALVAVAALAVAAARRLTR